MPPNWSIITDQWDADHYGIRGKMSTLMKWKSSLDWFILWDWFYFLRTKSIGAMIFFTEINIFPSTKNIGTIICFTRTKIFLPPYRENHLTQSYASSTLERNLCLTATRWVTYAWSFSISIKSCSNW